jgi:SAM-dependent methyltransferase
MHAVDISKEVVAFAQKGVYSLKTSELHDVSIFERMTENEMQEMFEREGDQLKIQPWIKEGITWHIGNAGDPEIGNVLGPQDIVVANRFLCHMDPPAAERCLRNIARLVYLGGHLFVSGVDLDVRTKVARDLGWKPVRDLIEEIHDGDPCLRGHWPLDYTGLEPFNKRRHDWRLRYACVFEINQKA